MTEEEYAKLFAVIDAAKPEDVKDALKDAIFAIDSTPEWTAKKTIERIEHVLKGGK